MHAPISRQCINAVRAELEAAFMEGRMEDYHAACVFLMAWLKLAYPQKTKKVFNAEYRARMSAAQRRRRQRERRLK